jgi:hypothetical protein
MVLGPDDRLPEACPRAGGRATTRTGSGAIARREKSSPTRRLLESSARAPVAQGIEHRFPNGRTAPAADPGKTPKTPCFPGTSDDLVSPAKSLTYPRKTAPAGVMTPAVRGSVPGPVWGRRTVGEWGAQSRRTTPTCSHGRGSPASGWRSGCVIKAPHDFPNTASSAQQPSACGPGPRRWPSRPAFVQPASSSMSARTGRSSKRRPT